jgi:hypothetical protein
LKRVKSTRRKLITKTDSQIWTNIFYLKFFLIHIFRIERHLERRHWQLSKILLALKNTNWKRLSVAWTGTNSKITPPKILREHIIELEWSLVNGKEAKESIWLIRFGLNLQTKLKNKSQMYLRLQRLPFNTRILFLISDKCIFVTVLRIIFLSFSKRNLLGNFLTEMYKNKLDSRPGLPDFKY